jgi:CARDB protein
VRKTACTLLAGFLVLAAPAAAQTVPTRAGLDSCHTGAGPLDRYAVFSAQMGSLPQSAKMQVRFDLQVSVGGGKFRGVRAPGLGGWRSSAPGVDIFRYRKQVANLQPGATYRALVRFRWLNDGAKALQSSSRKTKSCKQPDVRPDLVVGDITAEPAGQPGRARYTVVVRNAGRSDTPTSFGVSLSIGGEPQPAQTVQPLGAGDEQTLVFVGPRCDAVHPVRATVDSDLSIDESSESDNTRTVPCPLAG